MIKKVYFVTGNKNKVSEVQGILGTSVNLQILPLDLPEHQGSPAFIATEKCKHAKSLLSSHSTPAKVDGDDGGDGYWILVEDTCLCFNAMGGLPGPYIKHFLGELGHDGLNRMLIGFPDKSAYATCTFALCHLNTSSSGCTSGDGGEGEDVLLFEGRTNGKIVEARGSGDFGWDAIFEPDGYTKTFAEMEKSEKNSISHRFKALEKLKKYLSE